MLTSIYASDILGIVQSNHQSPHWILGIHPIEVIDQNGVKRNVQSVRAFLPEAKQAFVVEKDSKKEWEMGKVHNDGLFEGVIWDK
ncbi:MAG TPA: hypothetical protein PKK13_07150, partial [Spirochaetota bacterium]|nr:hypothetical protein [Spirochaetota bacterium]